MNDIGPSPRERNRRAERGLGLVEMLMAVVIGVLGLLAHASGILQGHNLARSEESRTIALQTMRELLERLRNDDDWASLYSRLGALLDSNGGWHATSSYYVDLEPSARLGTCSLRIDVPRFAAEDPVASPGLFLREDVDDDVFGLPHDLDGDGTLGTATLDARYLVLPVRVRLRWQAAGEPGQEIRISTWLTGERL
jgi:hypothetical protein